VSSVLSAERVGNTWQLAQKNPLCEEQQKAKAEATK